MNSVSCNNFASKSPAQLNPAVFINRLQKKSLDHYLFFSGHDTSGFVLRVISCFYCRSVSNKSSCCNKGSREMLFWRWRADGCLEEDGSSSSATQTGPRVPLRALRSRPARRLQPPRQEAIVWMNSERRRAVDLLRWESAGAPRPGRAPDRYCSSV